MKNCYFFYDQRRPVTAAHEELSVRRTQKVKESKLARKTKIHHDKTCIGKEMITAKSEDKRQAKRQAKCPAVESHPQ